jgi:hypothetical protein
MAAADQEIENIAHLLIQRHGDAAMAQARRRVEESRRKGDGEKTDFWLRVIVAIGTLGTPPTAARN